MACSTLQKSQEEASQRVDYEVARMQVPRQGSGIWAASWAARGSIWKGPQYFQPSPAQPMSFLLWFFPCSSFRFSSVHIIRPGEQPPNSGLSNIVATSHRWVYILKLVITLDN